ncbi:MAG: hypothetical protein H8E42_02215 [Nitrospinae bacterium]|nr:hypothetical protein [Nitrospinota bacterium]MBL7019548.1 hypothetical protein [Nitrospinaceae bacterium]
MKKSLEERFFSFLKFLPGSESIDSLKLPKGNEESQIADYFLANRQIIVEVKTLKSDTAYKVDEVLEPYGDDPAFPIVYGECDVNKILDKLDSGQEIKSQILEKLTRPIEKAFKKADDQVSDTKKAFNVENACGLLVLLNEEIDVFSPEVLIWKISKMLGKKRNGNYRYKQFPCVWVISESHYIQAGKEIKSTPSFCINGPMNKEIPEIGDFVTELQPKWAEFEGVPLLSNGINKFKDSDFGSFAKDHAKEQEDNRDTVERHELWRRQYRNNPYLRAFEEDAFLRFGAKAFLGLKPQFMKDGEKLSRERVVELLILWTHFLEENEYRVTDMRKLRAVIELLEKEKK